MPESTARNKESPFPGVGRGAPRPSNPVSRFSQTPNPHASPQNNLVWGKRKLSKQEEKEGNLDTAFRTRVKSRSSWSESSQVAAHTSAQRGISARRFQKKGGASPQSSLPKNSYTPFSTLTLIVPSILRNFQRTSTISQT